MTMFTHVLTPVDGSALSINAARQAVGFANLCQATLTVLMVSPPHHRWAEEGFMMPKSRTMIQRYKDEASARAMTALDKITAVAAAAGVKCKAVHLFADSPYQAIIKLATKIGCDVIVMGSHGYGGVKQFVVGSETTRVLSHTNIPVLVYR